MPSQPTSALLLSSTVELDKTLRQLLQSTNGDPLALFASDVRAVRFRLRDELQNLIFFDFEFAQTKDIEAVLWKTHYRVIDDFRKALKEITSRVRRAGRSNSIPNEKRDLRALTGAFRTFLAEAIAFYLRFIWRLSQAFALSDVQTIVLPELEIDILGHEPVPPYSHITSESQIRARNSCHRSLIYLGDLARYREVHADRKTKNWAPARMFYNIALQLLPSIGNPFNQLAVISTYAGDEIGAVENYFRSLVIKQSFATAEDNVLLLLERIQKRQESNRAGPEPDESDLVSAFIRRFLCAISRAFRTNIVQGDEFEHLIREFQNLERSRSLSGGFMRKVVIITLGALYLKQHPLLTKGTTNASSQLKEDVVIGTLSNFLINILEITLLSINERLVGRKSDLEFENDSASLDAFTDGYTATLCEIINILVRWLKCEYVENLVQVHNPSMWDALASFLSTSANAVRLTTLQETIGQTSAPEEKELAEFLPLQIRNDAWSVASPDQEGRSRQQSRKLPVQLEVRARVRTILQQCMYFTEIQPPMLFVSLQSSIWKFYTTAPPSAASESQMWETQAPMHTPDDGQSHSHVDDVELMFPPQQVPTLDPSEVTMTPAPIMPFIPLTASTSRPTQEEDGPCPPQVERSYSDPVLISRRVTHDESAAAFGTSGDAVNTMAFLGLGSPLRSKSASGGGGGSSGKDDGEFGQHLSHDSQERFEMQLGDEYTETFMQNMSQPDLPALEQQQQLSLKNGELNFLASPSAPPPAAAWLEYSSSSSSQARRSSHFAPPPPMDHDVPPPLPLPALGGPEISWLESINARYATPAMNMTPAWMQHGRENREQQT